MFEFTRVICSAAIQLLVVVCQINAGKVLGFPNMTHNSIGIIGAFNGWGDIEPMRKSTIDPHLWDITHTFASDTELKFRIAPDWSVNWGAESNDTAEKTYGKGKRDGANVKVKAGTYRILFNDIDVRYIFIKQ